MKEVIVLVSDGVEVTLGKRRFRIPVSPTAVWGVARKNIDQKIKDFLKEREANSPDLFNVKGKSA